MNNSDMPAYPQLERLNERGLTKREHFAAMAMQGFISAGQNGMPDADKIASLSIEYANALLAELAK